MRKFFTSILLIAILGQTFSQGLFFLDYLADRAAYERYCINKTKPQLHCNGKCQMMRKMQEEESKSQQAPEFKYLSKAEVIFQQPQFIPVYHSVTISIQQHFLPLKMGVIMDAHSSVFHPPC